MPDASQVVVSGMTGRFPGRLLRAAVLHALRREDRTAMISLTLLGRRNMRRLNATMLGHDETTDVISFPLPQPDGTLAGDVYICRDEAVRSARRHHCRVREELCRLAIHGALHVMGYDHPVDDTREQSDMWRRQELYLTEVSC